jgi:hypothetical protein
MKPGVQVLVPSKQNKTKAKTQTERKKRKEGKKLIKIKKCCLLGRNFYFDSVWYMAHISQ